MSTFWPSLVPRTVKCRMCSVWQGEPCICDSIHDTFPYEAASLNTVAHSRSARWPLYSSVCVASAATLCRADDCATKHLVAGRAFPLAAPGTRVWSVWYEYHPSHLLYPTRTPRQPADRAQTRRYMAAAHDVWEGVNAGTTYRASLIERNVTSL